MVLGRRPWKTLHSASSSCTSSTASCKQRGRGLAEGWRGVGRGVESEPGVGGGDRGLRHPPANMHLLVCHGLSVSSSDLLPGVEAPTMMLKVQTVPSQTQLQEVGNRTWTKSMLLCSAQN